MFIVSPQDVFVILPLFLWDRSVLGEGLPELNNISVAMPEGEQPPDGPECDVAAGPAEVLGVKDRTTACWHALRHEHTSQGHLRLLDICCLCVSVCVCVIQTDYMLEGDKDRMGHYSGKLYFFTVCVSFHAGKIRKGPKFGRSLKSASSSSEPGGLEDTWSSVGQSVSLVYHSSVIWSW